MSDTPIYELRVQGRDEPIPAPADRTVLDTLRKAGVTARYACRAGACRTCALRLVQGRIAMAAGTSLPDERYREGVFLACVTYPRGDLVVALPEGGPLVRILPWAE